MDENPKKDALNVHQQGDEQIPPNERTGLSYCMCRIPLLLCSHYRVTSDVSSPGLYSSDVHQSEAEADTEYR